MSAATYDLEMYVNAEGNKLACLGKTGAGLSYRIAGPKAWGGSKLIAKMTVREIDLVTFIRDYAPEVLEKLKEENHE